MKIQLAAGMAALLLAAFAAMPQARAFTIQTLDSNSDGSANFQNPDNKTPFLSQPTTGGATQSNGLTFQGSDFSVSVTGGQPTGGVGSPYYFRHSFTSGAQMVPGPNNINGLNNGR
jgi:hypothetical protein